MTGETQNRVTEQALQLDALRGKVGQLFGVYQARATMAAVRAVEVAELQAQAELLTLSEQALTTLLADVSAESLRAIEQTITYGLQTVFPDRGLAFRFDVTQSRGTQSVEPILITAQGEAPILDAYGGGPATLVAFLLRLITCYRAGLYPLVLMDEVFAMVSREYAENLAKLLRELAEKLGYTFVLVAHACRDELIAGATKAYEIVAAPDGSAAFQEVTA